MGRLLFHLRELLLAELPGVLVIFLDRLKNEITIRTITFISSSPLKVQI